MGDTLSKFSTQISDDIYTGIILVAVMVLAFVVSLLIFKIVSALVKRFSGSSYTLINKHLSLPFRSVLTVATLNVAQNFTYFKNLDNQFVNKLMYLALVAVLAYMLVKITEFIRDVLYERFDVSEANNLNERKIRTQLDFLQKAGSVFIILIATAVGLMSFDRVRELGTSLIASAGIASLIIGFAAQKSISNLLAGLQIAFTQPIRLDDGVVVEGEFGTVEEITLTYVVIKIWDSRRLIIPISYFLEKPFQNWTRTSADLLGTVILYADYSLPVDQIRTELTRILEQSDIKNLWDGRVAAVQVTDTTESTMQLRILLSAPNSGKAFDLRCMVRERMITFITQNFPNALPKRRLSDNVPSMA
jgi:small-conductance mechanosensitive channel